MKTKATLLSLIVILFIFFIAPDVSAQGKKNGPPPWAPAKGFRAKTRQIYFPEQNFYYDTQRGVYIYLNGNNWEVNVKLPSIFASIDLGRAAKVNLSLDTSSPQQYNSEHLVKYRGRNGDDKWDDKDSRKEKRKHKREKED